MSEEGTGRQPSQTFGEILGSDEAAIKKGNREAVRMMLPFALLVLIFLLLVFKLLYSYPSSSSNNNDGTGADDGSRQLTHCGEGSHQIQIQQGDTCWSVAEGCGVGVNELLALKGNDGLECGMLRVGEGVCVPG
jgi:hypothetical protein